MTASHPPPEHDAESAYCSDAQTGLPSEEAIARAMRPAVWARCDAAGVTSESTGSGITLGDLTARATSLLDANTVLDLIRPAFEAKERERDEFYRDGLKAEDKWIELEARALSAEAKLAQAVEALGRAKDEIVRTADDLSMHSPAVKLVEEIAAIIGQPALNSRAIVRETARAAAMGE